jgi:hypothetical protein
MTEAEWLAETDPARLIQFVEGRLSPRKTRLLAAALCRVADRHRDTPELARALDEVEWFADGLAGAPELDRARQQCRVLAVQQRSQSDRLALEGGAEDSLSALARHELAWAVAYAAASAVTLGDVLMQLSGEFGRSPDGRFASACRDRVLDVAGNPFRPVTFSPDWRTSTALSLASQMYDTRDFGAMPILADALQDVGCTSDDVLNHLRDATLTHVRGCWVLDGVLGRE